MDRTMWSVHGEVPPPRTTARRLVVLGCSLACTIVVAVILNHPETSGHISLLADRAFGQPREQVDHRIQSDLRRLEQDLAVHDVHFRENENANDLQYQGQELARHLPENDIGRFRSLHEGYSEDTQRRSEDIEPEARERIVSGEWPSEIVKADQEKGFMPLDLNALRANTEAMYSDDNSQLLAIAERAAKQKLAREFSAKQMALKRVFQYKERLLDEIAKSPQELAVLNHLQRSNSQDHPEAAIIANAVNDSPIGPSGLIAGDGTHLRKDVRLVGEESDPNIRTQQPTTSDVSSNPTFFNQQLSVYPYSASLRKAAESRLRDKAARLSRDERRRHDAVRRPARTQELTWPRPSPSTVPRGSFSGATIYDGDYNWPSSGEVHRHDEWENRGDCGMWGGNC